MLPQVILSAKNKDCPTSLVCSPERRHNQKAILGQTFTSGFKAMAGGSALYDTILHLPPETSRGISEKPATTYRGKTKGKQSQATSNY